MGTKERRQREAKQRREQILDAARTVFWREGYDGATMPQIAREAELAAGTLYLYFPNKDSLYVALLEEGYDRLVPRLRRATEDAASARGAAEGLIDAFFGFARDCPEYFGAMFFLLHRTNAPGGWERFDADLVDRLREGEAACRGIVADVLRAAGTDDGSAEATVDAVWSMLAGVVLYFRGTERFEANAARAREAVLRAVFAGGREEPAAAKRGSRSRKPSSRPKGKRMTASGSG